MLHLFVQRLVVYGLTLLAGVAVAQGYPPRALPLQSVRPFLSAAETAALLGLPPSADAAANNNKDNESVLYYRIADKAWCGAGSTACSNTRRYIIDHHHLRMAELEASGQGQYRLLRRGVYTDLVPQDEVAVGGQTHGALYPALYPLDADTAAVAVLAEENNYFSGGGSRYQVADFYTLPPPNAAPVPVGDYRNVPFFMDELYRACFSEQDYAKSPHCHEENSGLLRLSISAPGGGQQPYRWHLRWDETYWPGAVPKSQQRRYSTPWRPGLGFHPQAPR